jgi:hypothetical protein
VLRLYNKDHRQVTSQRLAVSCDSAVEGGEQLLSTDEEGSPSLHAATKPQSVKTEQSEKTLCVLL